MEKKVMSLQVLKLLKVFLWDLKLYFVDYLTLRLRIWTWVFNNIKAFNPIWKIHMKNKLILDMVTLDTTSLKGRYKFMFFVHERPKLGLSDVLRLRST